MATKPNPLLKIAQQIAGAGLQPSLDAANQAMEQDRIAAQNKAYMMNAVGAALANLSAGDSDKISGLYKTAADQQGAFSGGYSEALKQNAAAAQSQLDTSTRTLTGGPGLPTAPSGADTSLYLGNLPANTLAQAGASFGAAALERPKAYTGQYGNLALGALNEGDIQRKADQKAIADIEARRPGAVQDALTNLYQIQNSANANNIQRGYLRLQQAKTAQDRALAMTDMTGTIWKVQKNGSIVDTGVEAPGSNAFGQQTSRTAAQAAAKAASAKTASTKNRDQDLQDAQHLGASYALQLRGSPVQNPSPSKYNPGQKGAYMLAPGKVSELGPKATTTNEVTRARYDSPYTYASAYTQLWNYISGDSLMSRYSISHAKIDSLVRQLLLGAGWPAPAKPKKKTSTSTAGGSPGPR